MPKKKKKEKKKGKGEDSAKTENEVQKSYVLPGASEKEVALKIELEELNFELCSLKKQVGDLRKENEWLQKEAEETKQETQDYQTYVSRKAEKRQSLIVSLSDYNHKQLKDIAQEREELVRDYEDKKAGLNTTLLEKESELSKIKQELATLQPFKLLQEEQEDKIQKLEQQLNEERFAHEDKIRSIKTQFLKEKRTLEEASRTKIKEMADVANKQASECLAKHTQQIKMENYQLRQELQDLINSTNALQHQKKRLEQQYSTLVREHEFSQNLQQLRGSIFRTAGRTSSELDLGSQQECTEIRLPQLR